MAKRQRRMPASEDGVVGLGGFFGGLGTLLEKLGELAEKGGQMQKTGELRGADDKVHGVFGFNIKVGLGDEGIRVEPFGNVRKDKETGRPVVHEVREPMVDLFDEPDHVLLVAEMPGVGEKDVRVDLKEDILTIAAEKGDTKYRKEVLLPQTFSPKQMSHSCRNGILEVRLTK
jgi:HSP20 family protein